MSKLSSNEEDLYSRSEFIGDGCSSPVFAARITKEEWKMGDEKLEFAYSGCLRISTGTTGIEFYFDQYPGTINSEELVNRELQHLRKLASLINEFADKYESVRK